MSSQLFYNRIFNSAHWHGRKRNRKMRSFSKADTCIQFLPGMKHPTFQDSTRYVCVVSLCQKQTKEQQGFSTDFLIRDMKSFCVDSCYGADLRGKGGEIRILVYRFPIYSIWSILTLKPFSFLSLGCQMVEDKHSVTNFTKLPRVLHMDLQKNIHVD